MVQAERNPAPHLLLGKRGERIAERHLRRAGHRILRRNFRCVGGGEIDLVTRCKPDGCLVFVEVKTRSAGQLGRPLDAVDARKRRRIRSGARVWMRMLDDPDVPYRYDVVEVIIGTSEEVHIVPGAFTDER